MMKYAIRELREMAGVTQKEFANMYGIPLSTLRKWEQGESSPAPYIMSLIAKTLPSADASLQKIDAGDGHIYYYDRLKRNLADEKGNVINIQEDLEGVKEQNLVIYVQDLFEAFYEIQEKFNRDCQYDKEEDILWSR